MNTVAYVVINRDNVIREKSSSGAVFYELAKRVIESGGIVYGAKYDEDWSVIHGHTDTLEGLNDFLGSKYVQSSVADEYKDAEKNLKAGKAVLFSGTPCQIEGLKSFLGKGYEKLLTVDFICHGVPSPAVWKEYLKKVSNGQAIKAINFRDKTEGWQHFSLKIDFENGKKYRRTQQDDLYIKGFLQDVYLRNSCYCCRFKGIERMSDMTLADFWSVGRYIPEMFDDKGTSFVLLHSTIGKKTWASISDKFKCRELSDDECHKYIQPNAVASVSINQKRDIFFSSRKIDFSLLNRLTRTSFVHSVYRKAKRLAKKILPIRRQSKQK